MAKKKPEATKPPIKPKVSVPAITAVTPPNPVVAASTSDPSLAIANRIAALPSVGEALTAERIQGLFGHLFVMSLKELIEREKQPNISVLEHQTIRMMLKTFRELPSHEVQDKAPDGTLLYNKDGSPKMKLASLNKDQLQNEKQSLEVIKYLHERAFGKPKVTIEHQGLPGTTHNHLHMDSDAVLSAMDNLSPQVIDVLAGKKQKPKGK